MIMCTINENCTPSGPIRNGLCQKHYSRNRRNGNPLNVILSRDIRKPRINGTIPVLVSGGIADYRVDDRDDYIMSRNWFAEKGHGYAYTVDKGKKVYLHRYLTKAEKGKIVDHIDNDRTNNQKANLRVVDYKINGYNRSYKTNSSTGVRGVYPNGRGKFYAKAMIEGKNYYMGTYETIHEASKVVRRFWEDGTPKV